uniref:Putative secreted peptide n=1 Tax=Anopheles braziliensis TaxID=58242 RepID=A0A2M3ZPX3_9DIPT
MAMCSGPLVYLTNFVFFPLPWCSWCLAVGPIPTVYAATIIVPCVFLQIVCFLNQPTNQSRPVASEVSLQPCSW